MVIKLLQWNIWDEGEPDKILSFLKESSADIICAQEVIKDSRKKLDVAKYIAGRLGFEYYYHIAETWDNNTGKEAQGNAIFSKFPIVNTFYKYIQRPKHNPPNAWNEGRVYVEIKVAIENKELTIGTTHLSYFNGFKITNQRKKEVDTLLRIIRRRENYYLFAGDLNSVPDSYTIQELDKILKPSGPDYSEKSFSTKPFEYEGLIENDPNWRLDYIYSTNDVQIINSSIASCQYSDHLPILIEIQI